MHASTPTFFRTTGPPPEYEAAMSDFERRALQAQPTLAQARQEIFALYERFAPEPGAVMQWAAFSRS